MSLREVAGLLCYYEGSAAAIVDEEGRCLGMLTAADCFRWVENGCPLATIDPTPTCPYKVPGAVRNGDKEAICILADGSCPFQKREPTTGGRYKEVCTWQRTEKLPFGRLPSYTVTDVVTVRPETPLCELILRLLGARDDLLIVVDENRRAMGGVCSKDVLAAIAGGMESELGDPGRSPERMAQPRMNPSRAEPDERITSAPGRA
jgi:CBS domain-containing protein